MLDRSAGKKRMRTQQIYCPKILVLTVFATLLSSTVMLAQAGYSLKTLDNYDATTVYLPASHFRLDLPEESRCVCQGPFDPAYQKGVIWKGHHSALSARQIAEMLAPVLWFSADEPLLLEGKSLPELHPCDPDVSDTGIVYYQYNKIRRRGHERVAIPVEEEPKFFTKVAEFSIRFFFYYSYDFGFGRHKHDLELAEMAVFLERDSEGCYQIRLERVIGFAHGIPWYYNELEVERDTKFPISLIVEEGKHASCPDRNADGLYTPGYDVNQRINDAWGVRDIVGSGFLGAVKYSASMAKPRLAEFRMLPPELSASGSIGPRSSLNKDDGFLGLYELRPANRISPCSQLTDDDRMLIELMDKHRFGSQFEPEVLESEFAAALTLPIGNPGAILQNVSFRYDRNPGLALVFRGLDLKELYVVPRFDWIYRDNLSLMALFMPSAARPFSWYAGTGAAWERKRIKDEDGNTRVLNEHQWDFAAELGVKIRAPLKGKAKWFALGYDFAGLRLGVRTSGFGDLDPRFVIEIGAGTW